jgi:DNA helicase-2/ATP-dependent DNA helicase PcrA
MNSKLFVQETLVQNYRCSRIIIDFINNFNRILKYEQKLPNEKLCNKIPIILITGKDKNEIVGKFENLIETYNIQKEENKMHRLILADRWEEFNDITSYNPVGNSNDSSRTIFNECIRIVLGSLGINRTIFLDIIPYKDKTEKYLQFRQFCFSILKDIRNLALKVDSNFIIDKFNSVFKVKLPNTKNNIDVSKGIEKLKIVTKVAANGKYCSSIHTSKGLEATSVLVMARSNNQLKKWLDFANVIHDTDDDFRLGYVAFSRARELLCITTLEKPTAETVELMKKLKIEII